MPLIPLLPIFHSLNREHFDGALANGAKPLMAIRWSNGQLRKTAGFYSRGPKVKSPEGREIVLSRPVLEPLPYSAIQSTLCHEMIHAWTDLILRVQEGHGPNFHSRMQAINSSQSNFQVSVRHHFPIPKTKPKWLGLCPKCGFQSAYQRRLTNAACKQCCDKFQGGQWDPSYLLVFISYKEPV